MMAPFWAEMPGDDPAPLVLANTISLKRGRLSDALADRSEVERGVHAIGGRMNVSPTPTSPEPIHDDDVARLIRLRDAIRRIAAEHTRDPRSLGRSPVPDATSATAIVNESSALSSVWTEMEWEGSTALRRDVWVGESYAEAVISVIARQTIELSTSPDWERLRPCLAPGCAYFFIKDHVHRQWCSPLCGNRARVARHAERHRNT
jgi:predicted RNA-binding Zn ribbon-like protein